MVCLTVLGEVLVQVIFGPEPGKEGLGLDLLELSLVVAALHLKLPPKLKFESNFPNVRLQSLPP